MTKFGEWQILENGTRVPAKGEENFPAVLISYFDCRTFTEWAGYRIPTESEWEWAARGPNGYKYPWGNEWIDGAANLDSEDGLNRPEPVGSRPLDVSPFGVHDLAGNVMEFVEATYESYPGSTSQFRDERYYIVRGGSWGYPGKDQYNYTRYPFYKSYNGIWSTAHDGSCVRLARDI